jgi:hypothetical protein
MSDVSTFFSEATAQITTLITQANAIADRVANAGNAESLVAEVRNTSDVPEIVAFREWLDKANMAIFNKEREIDALIVEKGLVSTEPVDVPAETENYKALDGQIKPLLAAFKAIPGGDAVLSVLPERKVLPGTRKSSAGAGTGVKRPRISHITCDGKDIFKNVKNAKGEEVTQSNLTVLAAHLSAETKSKVEVSDLQSAIFAAAGTDDLSSLNGKPVEFVVNVEGRNFSIVATPTVKD